MLEAGPDPGPLGSPDWPADLVDATTGPAPPSTGASTRWRPTRPTFKFERSRVIGGCSAHNGCGPDLGHRPRTTAGPSTPGWTTDELLPYFERATEQLQVRTYERDELTPWHRALTPGSRRACRCSAT